MSIPTSKRRRKEKYTEDENNPKESSSASSQQTLGNGDTKIFSTLIPLMEDLDGLKTCRLVCKSWNKFACLALTKLPWVYYPVDESSAENIDNRLNVLVKNKTLELPSPFGNIQVYASTFQEQSFLRFLKYVRENTNSFSVELHINPDGENVDEIELRTVWTTNQHNFKITQLFIDGDLRIGDISQVEKIQLPYLKLLAIGDVILSDKILDLCGNICQFSPLKSLKIDGTIHGANLRKLMPPGGMKSVENLSLQFLRVYNDDCKYVCERVMEIPCIKKLSLYLRLLDIYPCDNCPEFEAIIEHFAESLESLTGDCLPMFKNKCFPKLREINFNDFRSFGNEFSFPVERYPLLNRATFAVKNLHELDFPYFEKSSVGIKQVSVRFLEYPDFPDEVPKFICAAGMVFPSVTSFSLHQPAEMAFMSSTLVAVCKSFPKLTAFELWADVRLCGTLTGFTLDVENWLSKGWPFEKIPRKTSLLDFLGLEKVTFGPDVYISEELFMYCLSRMPKLQYLTIYLELEIVSAETIRDSVGHLKRITIVIALEELDDLEDPRVEEMERLQRMLPSVVEIRKIPLESLESIQMISKTVDDLMNSQ